LTVCLDRKVRLSLREFMRLSWGWGLFEGFFRTIGKRRMKKKIIKVSIPYFEILTSESRKLHYKDLYFISSSGRVAITPQEIFEASKRKYVRARRQEEIDIWYHIMWQVKGYWDMERYSGFCPWPRLSTRKRLGEVVIDTNTGQSCFMILSWFEEKDFIRIN
jgi:hypothetical protein